MKMANFAILVCVLMLLILLLLPSFTSQLNPRAIAPSDAPSSGEIQVASGCGYFEDYQFVGVRKFWGPPPKKV